MSDDVEGTVIWFNSNRGYGYIRLDGYESDIYFRSSAVRYGHEHLAQGDRVEVSIRDLGRTGWEAIRVALVGGPTTIDDEADDETGSASTGQSGFRNESMTPPDGFVIGDGARARAIAGGYEVVSYSMVGDTLVVALASEAERSLSGAPLVEKAVAVTAYLDTTDDRQAQLVFQAIDELAEFLGYEGPFEQVIELGSIFRRAKATLRRGITTEDALAYRAKVEHAIELIAIGERQASVNSTEAALLAKVIESLADIPNACLLVGSDLIVKTTETQGPVIVMRPLSALELRTIERYPGIQRDPRMALLNLASAVQEIEPAEDVR